MEYVLLLLSVATLALVFFGQSKAEKSLDKMKKLLDTSERDAELTERLEALEQLVRQMDPEPTRRDVARLRVSISQLLEAPAAPEPLPADPEQPRAQVVRGLVERYLRSTGCDQIQLLSTDDELDAEAVEVRVEAMKQGLCLKGLIHVVGAEIREVSFDNTHKLFP